MRVSLGVAVFAALFVVGSGSWAGVIPVTNADFDSPSCPSGSCVPAGWTVNNKAGEWMPTSGTFNSIPDGLTQVAYANASSSLTQIVATTLALETTYTLTVEVGNRIGDAFGPVVELLAGSTVLGTATGVTPTSGDWDLWTLVFDSGASNAAVGQSLEISLGSTVQQTSFVEVSLSSTPDQVGSVPEPAMFALVGAGLLGLVTRRRFAR